MAHPTIIFCGGGSVGHVAPAVAVAQALHARRRGVKILFLCADREEEMAFVRRAGLPFYSITLPRFPRRISFRSIAFPVRFLRACVQSWRILRKERPIGVFSKGGSISVPVCLMAWCLHVPIILHESDGAPSVSTALLARFVKKICTGFDASEFPERLRKNIVQTGNPVRPEILGGSRAAGQRITGFSGRRPVLMVIGGSQGAVALNTVVDTSFDSLVESADIIHLTGAGKGTGRIHARYFMRPFVHEELAHLYTLADVVVTRAGAGVLSELAALRKPAVVVPLVGVGHDHQMKNARFLAERNAVEFLPQEQIDAVPARVMALLRDAGRRHRLGENLARALPADAAQRIAEILLDDFRC